MTVTETRLSSGRVLVRVAVGFVWFVAGFAADSDCLPCHPSQVRGFRESGMGQSMGLPTDHAGGEFVHQPSGTRVEVSATAAGLIHKVAAGGIQAEHRAAYFVGSGAAGRSYLVWGGQSLFQSPISYYSRTGVWGPSPGYENDQVLDFTRPVAAECLFCHAGSARPLPGTVSGYEQPPFQDIAISCERCHGDAGEHLASPKRASIVNPVRLPPRQRDSVCEQCHLSGEARILAPGKSFPDFRPGMKLEDVFTVFVRDGAAKVVDHSEQLAHSACAQGSGERLWCGTCHDPHQSPAEPVAYFRQRCLTCHEGDLPTDHMAATMRDCAGCHMPKQPVWDAPHTAFTDHEIRIYNGARPTLRGEAAIRTWRGFAGAHAVRNLGLAYVSAGEKHESAEDLQEGFRLLAGVQKQYSNDPDVLTALGLVLLRKNAAEPAGKLFARTVELRRGAESRDWMNLAVAQKASGQQHQAIEALEKALAIDPDLDRAYLLLAEWHAAAGRVKESHQALQRLLQRMPQHLEARYVLQRMGAP